MVADLPLLSSGKVREMYDLGDEVLMVASDRISTYDVVHPTPIPDKGKVLTGLSVFWFERTSDIVPNHFLSADVPEEAIGRQMRTYSSGQAARLRFAIASAKTHDVLLIDEALATGDARFRRRSDERIRELRDAAGTVFLVSHNLDVIRNTCQRGLWIDKGELLLDGTAGEVVDAYEAANA